MPDQLTLPRCVLPGCKTTVTHWGQPCDQCLDAFGARLKPTNTPPLTAAQIEARDRDTHAAYVKQALTRRPL